MDRFARLRRIVTEAATLGGQALEETDYTIFAVARFPQSIRARVRNADGEVTTLGSFSNGDGYFLRGTADGLGNNLKLGRVTRGSILRMTHNESPAADTAAPDDGGFHVYAFRFSQAEGMRVYVDGVLRVTRPQSTTPLQSFVVARLTAAWFERQYPNPFTTVPKGTVTDLAEFTAYSVAGTEEQIQEETLKLRQRYGI